MGMSVGLIVHDMDNAQRRAAYACDMTYGTNNEMGFDYLRDNMVIRESDMVQRGHAYAIVDEVDSILIDEARTPLIISGQGDKSTELYARADQFVSPAEKRRGLHRGRKGKGRFPHRRGRGQGPDASSRWKTSPTWKTASFTTTFWPR